MVVDQDEVPGTGRAVEIALAQVPDFMGDAAALERVLREEPEVLNHNLESVPRLYPMLRTNAVYQRSLDLLRAARLQRR
mgnify:CR=1 FL=1